MKKILLFAFAIIICCSSFIKPLSKHDGEPALKMMEADFFLENYYKPKNEIWVCYFWATWCLNCVRNHGILERLDKEFKDLHVRLISLSLDGSKKKWLKFMGENPATWEQVWASDIRFDKKFTKVFGDINNLPQLFIIKRNSESIRIKHMNELKSELQKIIEEGQ